MKNNRKWIYFHFRTKSEQEQTEIRIIMNETVCISLFIQQFDVSLHTNCQ